MPTRLTGALCTRAPRVPRAVAARQAARRAPAPPSGGASTPRPCPPVRTMLPESRARLLRATTRMPAPA